MSEYVSDCCGAEINEVLIDVEYDHDDMPIHDYQSYCTKCNKPCQPKPAGDKEEKEDEN